jgi:hypothetical protein
LFREVVMLRLLGLLHVALVLLELKVLKLEQLYEVLRSQHLHDGYVRQFPSP